ncbi:Broad-minded protein [Globisporangium polare]
MYHVVMTKRSRLDEASLSAAGVPISATSSEKELPTDAQKKIMNQLYKGYCRQLGLKASPTTLHCIMKKFGRHTLDSFPVTILMVLAQLFTEKEISAFLSCCGSSPGGAFLWNSRVSNEQISAASNTVLTLFGVASAVELVLERENPQLLQCIEQCHSSVLTLVLRWLGQCFWNYFDWNNVVLYIYLTVLHGPEFQVYIVLAVLKHLEAPLKLLSSKYNTQSMASFLELMGLPISGFRFGQWRNLFLRLRNEYHEEVLRVLYSTGAMKPEEPKTRDV